MIRLLIIISLGLFLSGPVSAADRHAGYYHPKLKNIETYRARVLFTMMTTVVHKSPIFKLFKVESILTFYDLAKMLGFKQITISDGDKFSH
ncbi:MAG: hypothetical protein QF605_03300 [Rhodospirillales bacterium]|nr:hypothetical protein [Rhodospirillales bacterium]